MSGLVGKFWTGAKGAAKYAAAYAKGDIADDDVAACRFEGWCMSCPSVTHRPAMIHGRDEAVEIYYCGKAFVEQLETVMPTCGCLVGLTINGMAEPGGKTVVRSSKCPQKKW